MSFQDGLRYYDNKANYQKMRDTSDRLCRKYQLSVIDKPSYKSEHYASWKEGPSIRSLIKKDVDYAISVSMTMKQFVQIMEKMGYTFKFNKHWAVLPPNGKKYIRLRSLSDDGVYSQEGISKRILEIKTVKYTSTQNNNSPKKLHRQANQLLPIYILYHCQLNHLKIQQDFSNLYKMDLDLKLSVIKPHLAVMIILVKFCY